MTAVSLEPLPPRAELRDVVDEYLARAPRPGDVLRALADALDAAGTLDALPARAVPVHEAQTFLVDYRKRVHRTTYRCTAEHALRLAALAQATGLAKSSVVRAALAARRAELA